MPLYYMPKYSTIYNFFLLRFLVIEQKSSILCQNIQPLLTPLNTASTPFSWFGSSLMSQTPFFFTPMLSQCTPSLLNRFAFLWDQSREPEIWYAFSLNLVNRKNCHESPCIASYSLLFLPFRKSSKKYLLFKLAICFLPLSIISERVCSPSFGSSTLTELISHDHELQWPPQWCFLCYLIC